MEVKMSEISTLPIRGALQATSRFGPSTFLPEAAQTQQRWTQLRGTNPAAPPATPPHRRMRLLNRWLFPDSSSGSALPLSGKHKGPASPNRARARPLRGPLRGATGERRWLDPYRLLRLKIRRPLMPEPHSSNGNCLNVPPVREIMTLGKTCTRN
ncbi:hypothetical protein CISG_00238 [Coccidioides immitis RMSCC 3703]|uniref:Uncharacterized protein n=2 Tax=Coccidioides immitis TaxID=5501 RepID=A0A0J8QHV6_COCIT|nr:hypothetical protein CIRG_07301 [Coccidioides immitis RMSCC 2394]KMU71929.1 hypothetical protein CISG_00238 [Coccidioides immitis RMSCC 3703]